MIKLTKPNEVYLQSFMEAFEGYKAHGISDYGFTDATAVDIFEIFEDYRTERNQKPNRAWAHFFWLVDDERGYFLGVVAIRHRLNAE